MPFNQQEIISVCQQLADEQNLRICVTESFKGAAMAGVSALAGGLLLGPAGLAIGGVIGSLTAAMRGKGKFKSVAEVIMYDMTPYQKAKLAQSIKKAVMDVRPEEIVMFGAMIMSNASLKQLVITELMKFLRNELNLSIL